jgi:hypothetical protein
LSLHLSSANDQASITKILQRHFLAAVPEEHGHVLGENRRAVVIEGRLYDPTNAALRAWTASAIFDGFGMPSMA